MARAASGEAQGCRCRRAGSPSRYCDGRRATVGNVRRAARSGGPGRERGRAVRRTRSTFGRRFVEVCGSRARAHPVRGARRSPRRWRSRRRRRRRGGRRRGARTGCTRPGRWRSPNASTAAAAVECAGEGEGKLTVGSAWLRRVPSRSGRLVSPATTPALVGRQPRATADLVAAAARIARSAAVAVETASSGSSVGP